MSNSRENLEDHVEESQTKRAEVEMIESIRRGVADHNGRVQSLSDVDGKIRNELGFAARNQ